MILSDTLRLCTVISQIWPAMKLDALTPDAWTAILDDVTLDDALAATRHFAKTRTGWITPADIRRQIAVTAGLLPTSEADGLTAAIAVAARHGTGSRQLDPVTYAAYRAMGGPGGFDAKPGILRSQWSKVWADCSRTAEEDILGGDLGTLVAAKRPAALTAGPAVAVLEEAPAPTVVEPARRSHVAELLAFTRSVFGPGDPDKLRTREAAWRKQQRPTRLDPTPNPHFTGFPVPTDSEQS